MAAQGGLMSVRSVANNVICPLTRSEWTRSVAGRVLVVSPQRDMTMFRSRGQFVECEWSQSGLVKL